MSLIRVKPNDVVKAGQTIGLVGNSGLTSLDQRSVLTFEVRYNRAAQDPLPWLREKLICSIALYGENRLQYLGCTSLLLVDKLFLYKLQLHLQEHKATLSGCPPSENKGSFRLECFSKAAIISGARGGTPGARGGDFPLAITVPSRILIIS